MKIGIQTWGSHGDTRSFIALAEDPQHAGHDVTVYVTCLSGTDYRKTAGENGFNLKHISSAFPDNKEDVEEFAAQILKSRFLRQLELIIEMTFIPVESEMYQAAEQLCQNNEVIIGHHAHYPIQITAKKYKRPYASVTLTHAAIPGKMFP